METNPTCVQSDRFDEEGDWLVRQMFSDADLAMSPEEYAARNAHRWGCFAYHRYRYRDPVLGAWVQRLGKVVFDEAELERCRRQFLTPDELADVRRQAAEEF
jgi:hypothetical protein